MKASKIIEIFRQWRAARETVTLCAPEDQPICSAISTSIPLLAKQIPKTPLKWSKRDYHNHWDCPTCKRHHKTEKKPNYCDHCGQRLDWTEQHYKFRGKPPATKSIDEALADAETRSQLELQLKPPIKHNQSENEM